MFQDDLPLMEFGRMSTEAQARVKKQIKKLFNSKSTTKSSMIKDMEQAVRMIILKMLFY